MCISMYFNSAEVHGVFDDVVVIVELQSLGVDGLVERPGVGCVLLGQHFLQDFAAVPELLARAALFSGMLWKLPFFKAILGRVDGSA